MPCNSWTLHFFAVKIDIWEDPDMPRLVLMSCSAESAICKFYAYSKFCFNHSSILRNLVSPELTYVVQNLMLYFSVSGRSSPNCRLWGQNREKPSIFAFILARFHALWFSLYLMRNEWSFGRSWILFHLKNLTAGLREAGSIDNDLFSSWEPIPDFCQKRL